MHFPSNSTLTEGPYDQLWFLQVAWCCHWSVLEFWISRYEAVSFSCWKIPKTTAFMQPSTCTYIMKHYLCGWQQGPLSVSSSNCKSCHDPTLEQLSSFEFLKTSFCRCISLWLFFLSVPLLCALYSFQKLLLLLTKSFAAEVSDRFSNMHLMMSKGPKPPSLLKVILQTASENWKSLRAIKHGW